MRLIDVEPLECVVSITPKGVDAKSYNDGFTYALELMDKQPTIDAVPVTRCRDCTRHKVEVINGAECWRCPLRELDVRADYYCADGVRV